MKSQTKILKILIFNYSSVILSVKTKIKDQNHDRLGLHLFLSHTCFSPFVFSSLSHSHPSSSIFFSSHPKVCCFSLFFFFFWVINNVFFFFFVFILRVEIKHTIKVRTFHSFFIFCFVFLHHFCFFAIIFVQISIFNHFTN